jgi:biopolymer transport protein ExbD
VQVDSDRARADSLRETLEKHKAEMAELAQQRRPYDEVRRELRALEAMRERLELRLIQERIEVIANPVVAHKRTPSGRASEDRRSAVQVVDVSEDGKYRVAGRQVSLEELTKTLKEARNASPGLVVELRMVDQANFQNVAALLDRCQAQGIANVSLKMGSKP